MEIEVKNVIEVAGNELHPSWKISMYLIITADNKVYIDNTKYHRYAKWIPAEWKKLIGKTIEIDVVQDSGYSWAKYKEK